MVKAPATWLNSSHFLVPEELVRKGDEPNVTFAFVVDEGIYGRGAAELIAIDVKAGVCLVLEPTNLQVCVGNASRLEFKLVALGRSSHGTSRENSNAINLLLKV